MQHPTIANHPVWAYYLRKKKSGKPLGTDRDRSRKELRPVCCSNPKTCISLGRGKASGTKLTLNGNSRSANFKNSIRSQRHGRGKGAGKAQRAMPENIGGGVYKKRRNEKIEGPRATHGLRASEKRLRRLGGAFAQADKKNEKTQRRGTE